MKKWNCILFGMLIISQLIGCGQSGKLYLPEKTQDTTSEASNSQASNFSVSDFREDR